MNREELKRAIDAIKPPKELKSQIEQAMQKADTERDEGSRKVIGSRENAGMRRVTDSRPDAEMRRMPGERRNPIRRPVAAAVAGILLLAAVGVGYYSWDGRQSADGRSPAASVSPSAGIAGLLPGENAVQPSGNGPSGVTVDPQPSTAPGSVYLPKIKLPEENGATMSMVGLVVYKGKIYTQTMTRIAPEQAASLRGEKLGRSKGGIDEWSSQSEFANEFASTIGEIDIYSVKGYDEGFRLMAYREQDGQIHAELYENLNGRTIASGADLFDLLRLKGRIASAESLPFDAWNNGIDERLPLPDMKTVDEFANALDSAKPLERKPLWEAGIYDNSEQAIVRLHLEDGTEVELRLFEQGYVSYGYTDVLFQVDAPVFERLWNELQALKP